MPVARSATLAVALTLVLAPAAVAAPVDVHVRVEGAAETLFDRVVRSDAITLQTPDDLLQDRGPHACDGTNAGRNPAPGATATGATADAMSTLGQDLDGEWFGGFDDYFVTRIGPDAESDEQSRWWGVLVNRVFTSYGGCQVQVQAGDEVLWVYDAFSSRPFLWLDGPATVTVGAPAALTVTATDSSTDGPGAPGAPRAGAAVAEVDAGGRTVAGGAGGAATDAAGATAVTFAQPGWHRLKARDQDPGGYPRAIASNSVDVCVEAVAGSGCDGLPPSRQPVVPARLKPVDPPADLPREPLPPVVVDPPAPPAPPLAPVPPVPSTAAVRLSAPQLGEAGAASGRVAVRWSVLDAGAGIRGWTLAAKPLGGGAGTSARFADRATGTTATSALLKLFPGRSYALRLTVTDVLGRGTTLPAGTVLVPLDERARGFAYSRGWRRAQGDDGAWNGTVANGGAGASVRLRLAAGRPAFALRATRSAATVELVAGSRRTTVRVAAAARGGGLARTVTAARRARAGDVTLRVLSGTVALDGAGLAP